ncbi:MAG: hypothetical protein WBA22_05100 [Candidatus Methanofastidiosia archaeon]
MNDVETKVMCEKGVYEPVHDVNLEKICSSDVDHKGKRFVREKIVFSGVTR